MELTAWRLESNDIAGILKLNDGVENIFPCDRGEWVQWLMANKDNPKVLIIGDGKSYLVAVDTVQRPLNDSVTIIFFYSKSKFEDNIKNIKVLNDWAKEIGAKQIRFICKNIKVFEKYGASQIGIIGGWNL